MAKAQTDEMRAHAQQTERAALNGIEPMLKAGNTWIENWMAVGSEMLDFGRSRLDRNLETSKAIARSTSLDEAIELQVDYTRSVLRDYFTEAGKLADLGARALVESLRSWQPAPRAAEAQQHPAA